jgi:hypothetical protein
VHYRYFRGGSKAAWEEEHQFKEQWADCVIYQFYLNADSADDGFNGIVPIRLPSLGSEGDDDAISQAQQEFIDQRVSTEAEGGVVSLPERERSAAIVTRIADNRNRLGQYLRQFNRKTCDSFAKFVKNYDWTLDELEEYYKKSIEATRQVTGAFPDR